MHRVATALALFIIVTVAVALRPSSSLAQENCSPVTFPAGKNSVVLNGIAPPEDGLCYRLTAEIGDKFTLKVLRGSNTVFAIVDVQDAQDRFTFVAQKESYRVNVGQLMRAAKPQKFRISITRSATVSAWPVFKSSDPDRVQTEKVAADRAGRITLACNKLLGSGLGMSLYDYTGEALGRTDGQEYPVKLVVAHQSDGSSFDVSMHYFEPDGAWVLSGDAPSGFIESLGAGSLLALENGRGEKIAEFDLKGVAGFERAVHETCGPGNQEVAAASALPPDKTAGEGSTSGSATTPASSAGQAFRDCENCPEMMPLSPGTFMMGASKKEVRQLKYVNWSLPQHQVTIAYPFAIGRYEVSVGEFDAYVKESGVKVGGKCGVRVMESGEFAFKYSGTLSPGGDKGSDAPYVIYIADGSYAQPGLPVTSKQPATCVSRNEIKGYLDWLSKKTGRRYRLPTEAEWEYAYRAGTDTIAHWGDDLKKACDYANFGDRKSGYQAGMAATCSEKIQPGWTAEVGSYKPNPWGLYDMAGNAQEAVEDCFHDSYNGAPSDGTAWMEGDCALFVARGGDFELTQFSMRASERLLFGYVEGHDDGMWTRADGSDERFNVMGFRVALSLAAQ